MKRLLLSLALALPLIAQPVAPPPPAAPREAKLPQPVEKTLENGLRVIVVPKHDIPLVATRLLVRGGGAQDPADRDGLASLTAAVLTKGTKTRTAEQIARGVEALGATLGANADWDSMSIDLSVMSSNLPKAMEYVADVARNATFPKSEFDRERAQAIEGLQVELSEPRPVASIVAARLVFADTPYGHNLGGLPSTLSKITRADLVRFHAANYRPDNAVLVLAGDIKAEDAFKLAQTQFGAWRRGAAAASAAEDGARSGPRSTGRILVIDMPESGQAAVIVARHGIRRSDPAYMQALVANSILGGGYSSRLNQEIRIKRGLSYGAGSSFDPRADVGPFRASTQTKHESAAEVAGIITTEMGRLGSTDVLEPELVPRKAALTGEFAQSLETTSGIVNRVSALALHGLPLTDINRYISGVNAVTAEDVRKFSSANLGSKDVNIVVAGDAKQFLEPLRKQFGDVEVIPVADLDLSSPTLRVRKAKE
ncbi:MAG TPA: pitrilysin family protein [Thermoanaerobaculia bacterium]|nr:pitrilysin family protein [Thermoanaerobaculia bacterium]